MKFSKDEIIKILENNKLEKYPTPTLREMFFLRHHGWIDFLNDRENLKKLDKTNLVKSAEKGIIFSDEASWQKRNDITEPDPDYDGMSKKIKFVSQRELVTAIYDFMYENLKAISRGQKNELSTIGKFGIKEAFLLFDFLETGLDDKANIFYQPKELIYKNKKGECSTPMFDIAMFMVKYLEYIRDLLKYGVNPKIGVFMIGVCPYHKLKDKKKCGKVFIGGKLSTKACEKHANIWKVMMIQRAKLGKIIENFKKE